VNISKSQTGSTVRLFIFPAILTNAKLTVCQFKSRDVKITDGTLDLTTVPLNSVPFIRFRKSLVTEFPKGNFRTLKDAHRARERSIFIVNSEGLLEFLKDWKVTTKKFAMENYIT
jgi:hypothetical protein